MNIQARMRSTMRDQATRQRRRTLIHLHLRIVDPDQGLPFIQFFVQDEAPFEFRIRETLHGAMIFEFDHVSKIEAPTERPRVTGVHATFTEAVEALVLLVLSDWDNLGLERTVDW